MHALRTVRKFIFITSLDDARRLRPAVLNDQPFQIKGDTIHRVCRARHYEYEQTYLVVDDERIERGHLVFCSRASALKRRWATRKFLASDPDPCCSISLPSERIGETHQLGPARSGHHCEPQRQRGSRAGVETCGRCCKPSALSCWPINGRHAWFTAPTASGQPAGGSWRQSRPIKQTLSKTDGSEAELSSGELDLLRILVENANRPLSRDELLEKSVHRDWGGAVRS